MLGGALIDRRRQRRSSPAQYTDENEGDAASWSRGKDGSKRREGWRCSRVSPVHEPSGKSP